MMKQVFLVVLAMLSVFSVTGQTINSEKSKIEFSVQEGKKKVVKGEISGMDGTVIFNEDDLKNSKMKVSIDPTTVKTDSKMRDKHLQSKLFFKTADFPKINFTSKEVKKDGDQYIVIGELEMLGIKKDAEILFTYESKTLNGTMKVNRQDFTLGPKKDKSISFNVEINIICVLN